MALALWLLVKSKQETIQMDHSFVAGSLGLLPAYVFSNHWLQLSIEVMSLESRKNGTIEKNLHGPWKIKNKQKQKQKQKTPNSTIC